MGEARKRIGLVHELAQLARAEELLDSCGHRSNVDQTLRGDRVRILSGHALAHNPLETGQTDPELVLNQFPDRPDTTIAKVVDVVGRHPDLGAGVGDHRRFACVQRHQVLDRIDDVLVAEHLQTFDAIVLRGILSVLLADLVATNPGEVVALRIPEQGLNQPAGGLHRGRLARAKLAIEVEECLFLVCGGVLLDCVLDRLGPVEHLENLFIGFSNAQRLEEGGDVLPALAIDPNTNGVLLVCVELKPCSSARDDLPRVDEPVGRLVLGGVEVDPRRANELGDDDPLGAVDDEHAFIGHDREVTEEHLLLFDLTRLPVHESRGNKKRPRVVGVTLLGLLEAHLGFVESMVG